MELKENQYQCAKCGGVFTKGWSDEEAEAEYKKDFGYLPPVLKDDPFLICDDCYNEIFGESTAYPDLRANKPAD